MTKTYRGPLAILAALVLFALTTTTALVTHEIHGASFAALAPPDAPAAVHEVVPAPEPCDHASHEAPGTIG